jgi:tetratricopeptide (TPR) repeat protein
MSRPYVDNRADETSALLGLVLLCLASAALAASPPRLNFTRAVPAPHDLAPAERIAITGKSGAFADALAQRINRSGHLRVESPADVTLDVNGFACSEEEKSAEGSERDSTGARVKRKHTWVDVTCSAHIEVVSAGGRHLFSYQVHGEGTSPRVISLTDEERMIARDQATRYAAIDAAEAVTPRSVRESIELDDTAPTFDEGWAMIVADRFADARAIWEQALRRHADSAALHYDLAAVCEAMGDVKAAGKYYEEAQRRSPKDRRYKTELALFRKRVAK